MPTRILAVRMKASQQQTFAVRAVNAVRSRVGWLSEVEGEPRMAGVSLWREFSMAHRVLLGLPVHVCTAPLPTDEFRSYLRFAHFPIRFA